MLLALFLACAIPYPQACDQYAQEYCGVCELTKEEKAKWACRCGSPKCTGTMLRKELPK
jgi:SET domain-containing protein